MNYRYGVITAITWRLVAEFFRRHSDKADFNIMELHPCSGMYDCLSLFVDEGDLPGRHLFDFNQGSGNLHIFGIWDRPTKNFNDLYWPNGNSYTGAFLCADDTSKIIDDLESLIGMPPYDYKGLPEMTAKVFMLKVIASLLQRHALGREIIDVRSALHDSSWGAHIREEVKTFNKVYNSIPQDNGYEKMARATINYWMISVKKTSEEKIKAIIDLRGGIYLNNKPEIYIDLWNQYKEGKSIAAIVSNLDKFIMQ